MIELLGHRMSLLQLRKCIDSAIYAKRFSEELNDYIERVYNESYNVRYKTARQATYDKLLAKAKREEFAKSFNALL